MTLLRPPGVYRAQDDTAVLAHAMRRGGYARDRAVLDVGTGTGALALAAARAGAATVTAVDLSVRSVLATWLNTRLRGLAVEVALGDLFAAVPGRRFGLVVTNPPYVPAQSSVLPRHQAARCWDAGHDGRGLLDRICAGAPDVLTADGRLLLVQSEVSGEDATLAGLATAGLHAEVTDRVRVPFGPVLRAREPMLRARGLLRPEQTDEELIVIEACRHD